MASEATTRVLGSNMGRKLPSLTQLNALEELVGSSLAEAIGKQSHLKNRALPFRPAPRPQSSRRGARAPYRRAADPPPTPAADPPP